ncbi:amino acid dehydrogenase [Sandarakinorhabdus sp. AAP62]|uniref:Leu/Phe/Val dehydrogenase n=1 Tax=Sandarakinorhabdus sp. AAP62 TaxID=1248916 RepID=UPI0003056939|nr:amino acid dehydrogenase [Sandarakinorhabdus sp. AAP62]
MTAATAAAHFATVQLAALDAAGAPAFDSHERVALVQDVATGLHAIVAIHSTHLGPAAGGVRRWAYASETAALTDALRLSRGMSYKNAMAGLKAGGGKAVLIAPQSGGAPKTEALLEAFGDAVAALGGHYVTAEDVGMTEHDMVVVSRRTAHVAGLPVAPGEVGGNPGPFTARGALAGLKAAVRHKLGSDRVAGLHVAIQGVGSVGGALARALAAEGARLTIADFDPARAAALAAELGATQVDVSAIMAVKADVFSPNALGAILDQHSIAALDVAVVAGAANNQLATPEDGARLAARGILYAPDYVINAGGIISVVAEYLAKTEGNKVTLAEVHEQVDAIGPRLAALFAEADTSGLATDVVADQTAQRLIGR